MGTWGVHSFDNDLARDWAGVFRTAGLGHVEATLRVAEAADRLDADTATLVVAAADGVAVTLGQSTAQR